MKIKPIFLYIIIVTLIVLDLLLILKHRNLISNYKENEQEVNKHISIIYDQSNELRSMIVNILHSESTIIDENIILEDVNSGLNETIKQIAASGPILFIRISQNSCHVCIERELQYLAKMNPALKESSVYILASYESLGDLRIFIKENNISFPVFRLNDDSLAIPLEKLTVPYFFVLDDPHRVANVFYPVMSCPELTEKYFSILRLRYPDLFNNQE